MSKELVGHRIMRLRRAAGHTLRQKFAPLVGISTHMLVQYEREKPNRAPPPEIIAKIAELLGVSAEYILRGDDDPTEKMADVEGGHERNPDLAIVFAAQEFARAIIAALRSR
jgi:transcriptional regulator with XRE-family HTH domain